MSDTGTTTPIEFGKNATAALADAPLHEALQGLTTVSRERRRLVLASTSEWESLRDRASAIKEHTLVNLDRYLEQFTERAERAGATIHWARTADEAREIVIGLAREYDAELVIKSKSMLSEEIHLNAAFERSGIAPVETDLGEWILQLANETPSHIVVPAIHKTRAEIAKLFAARLGTPPDADAATLTAAARRVLRPSFAKAKMGVSGVNFGVAETGSILILENEGNARLSTSLPQAHVALMGIEKIIPRLADLDLFLRLLPRAATGQRLTVYQSLLTGITPSGDGPRALHIVLVDNGRSAMLAHPLTRQSLACIRCGACLNACPVYQQVGGHAYGSVYPGPIGAVITPQLSGIGMAAQLPYASSLCGACREVCPVKIDIPALLLHLRAEATEGAHSSTNAVGGTANGTPTAPVRRVPLERVAFRLWRAAMLTPSAYAAGASVARWMQRIAHALFGRHWGRKIGAIVPPLGAWTANRDLAPLASRSFRELWEESSTLRGGNDAPDQSERAS